MDGNLLDPRDLEVLVRIVDSGTVTRAASQMYISQPALSQRLRRLERAVGVRLVKREGRRLALTEEAQAILPLARRIQEVLEQIPQVLSRARATMPATVNLGASATIGEFVLPRRLSRFARACPHITVRLHIENSQGVVQRVLDRTLHVGIVGLRPASAALVSQPFLTDDVVLVAAPRHPLAGCRVTPDRLIKARLLVREVGSATRTLSLEALTRSGVHHDSAVGFGSNGAVLTAARSGYGVAALSRVVVADDLKLRRLREVHLRGWHCPRQFYVIHRQDRSLSRVEETLLQFLRRENVPERLRLPSAASARLRAT